jgi:4-amino-4-deoxy-L-arabinose transferase-like glycosyltransferase
MTGKPQVTIRPQLRTTPRRIGPLGIHHWLLLLGICLAVFFVNLGGARTLTSHEVDAAGGARQMIADGDWLKPKIGDHLWLEKPPLFHWFVSVAYLLSGGASEWAARLPSALAGSIIVFLMASTVGYWRGPKAGVVAGCIQCTTWQMMNYARLSEADMLLASIVVSAIVVFIHLQGIGLDQPARRHRLLAATFWILIGMTNLCKGPFFGAAMALMPCMAWLLWRREKAAWVRMWSLAGLLLGAAIAASWYVLIIWQVPDILDLWLFHTLGRAAGDTEYGQPWWYYLQVPPGRLMPWTVVTLIGVIPSWKRMWHDSNSADRFTWLWALVPMVVLSLSDGKHHHYLIPCLPGFTLVTTTGVFEIGRCISEGRRFMVVLARFAIFILAPLSLVGGLVAGIYLADYRIDAWVGGVLLSVCFLLAGLFTLKQQPDRVFAAAMLTTVLVIVQVHLHVLPTQDDRRQNREFLTTLQKHLPPQFLLFATGGPDIAREIFQVQVPLIGVWRPQDIGKHLGDATVFYVVGKRQFMEALKLYGTVTVLTQAQPDRHGKYGQEPYLLYRIQRT